ncbi:MAG: MFS transporter [Candidatus Limnocylindrales bacterium]
MTASSPATPTAPARTADLFTPARRGMTLGLVSTITLVALESLAIGTVMPIVAGELGDLQLYGWVYTAFFLGNLLGIVLAGGALDRLPLHRPFAAGLVLFGLGLLIGGLAPSMPILVLARFIQGLGGGAVAPTAYVAIGRLLPQHLQPRMFAMLSTAWVVPGIIGPSIAAVVGELASWRWVFLGLVPLLLISGTVAVTALRRVSAPIPEAEHLAAQSTFRRLPSALLAAGGAGVLVAGLTAQDILYVIGGAAIGAALLIPAFRNLTPRGTLLLAIGVPAAVALRGVMTFAFFSGDAYLPLLLQTWRGTPATLTGLVFTATTIAWTAGTWFQARRIDRWGPRRFTALGFGCIAAGALLTIPVVLRTVPPEITIVTWILPGVGMGFMYSAVTLVVLQRSSAAEQGSASSALQLSDILGTALGTGVAGSITAAGERAGGDGLGIALAIVFGVSVAAALLGMLGARRIGVVPHVLGARTAAVD